MRERKRISNVCLKYKCLFNHRNCTIVTLTCSKRAKLKTARTLNK